MELAETGTILRSATEVWERLIITIIIVIIITNNIAIIIIIIYYYSALVVYIGWTWKRLIGFIYKLLLILGTATFDGTAIAHSVVSFFYLFTIYTIQQVDYLVSKINCRTLFATHYHSLVSITITIITIIILILILLSIAPLFIR